jgi:hypothetical protein
MEMQLKKLGEALTFRRRRFIHYTFGWQQFNLLKALSVILGSKLKMLRGVEIKMYVASRKPLLNHYF